MAKSRNDKHLRIGDVIITKEYGKVSIRHAVLSENTVYCVVLSSGMSIELTYTQCKQCKHERKRNLHGLRGCGKGKKDS